MSPQEGSYTKIAAIVGVIGLVIAFLAWIHPFAPRSATSIEGTGRTTMSSEPSTQPPPGSKPSEPTFHPAPLSDAPAMDTGRTTMSSKAPAQPPPGLNLPKSTAYSQSSNKSHSLVFEKPPIKGDADLTSGKEGAAQQHTAPFHIAKPTRACDAPETTTLRPGAPARVASGLAVLSVKTAREGSEPYLTLGIASDRDTLAEAVLGAPARFHFKTSLGTYFVNIAEADLAVGALTVQVGCEAEGNTP